MKNAHTDIMNHDERENYETICRNIRRSTPPSSRWQWDGRFGVAVLVLEKKESEALFAALGSLFTGRWDSCTIRDAPKPVRSLVKNTLDIQSGQTLFTAGETAQTVLLGAWWPWSNGGSISFRIGIFPLDKASLDADDPRLSLERWFGIDR